MAKKGSAKPRARKRKKKTNVSPKLQLMKIVAGVTLLVCLVVTAGLLANRFLMRPVPQRASKPKPISTTRPETGPVHYSVPDYEAFHREAVVPPPPITRVKPITNGIPVAIIIDDVGYDRKMAEGFLELNVPLTFSVLPRGPFNHSIIDQALKKDVEIMLHLPMEPSNYPSVNPGPGALLTSMNPDELIAQLNANLDRVPNVKGVNNHMGSKLTASSDQMRQIFEAVTYNGAKAMGLDGYGLAPGCRADIVILQAANVHDALRLKPARLYVIRRGTVIAQTPPVVSRLALEDRHIEVDFRFPAL